MFCYTAVEPYSHRHCCLHRNVLQLQATVDRASIIRQASCSCSCHTMQTSDHCIRELCMPFAFHLLSRKYNSGNSQLINKQLLHIKHVISQLTNKAALTIMFNHVQAKHAADAFNPHTSLPLTHQLVAPMSSVKATRT